jgi:hypothetical protein
MHKGKIRPIWSPWFRTKFVVFISKLNLLHEQLVPASSSYQPVETNQLEPAYEQGSILQYSISAENFSDKFSFSKFGTIYTLENSDGFTCVLS